MLRCIVVPFGKDTDRGSRLTETLYSLNSFFTAQTDRFAKGGRR
jgi:hypothetical protein